MSYCRFENTMNDLRDCLRHIADEIFAENEEDTVMKTLITSRNA